MKITIARECGCYGDEVGQVLADRLNVPLYNKKTLTELAKKKGILEHYPDYFVSVHRRSYLASDSWLSDRKRNQLWPLQQRKTG